MPGSFQFPRLPEMWVPAITDISADPTAPDEFAVIARLKPGVSITQSQSEVNVLAKEWEKVPHGAGWFNSKITPLASQVAGDTRRPLLLLLAAVGVVLLIACANVANLLLARSAVAGKSLFAPRWVLLKAASFVNFSQRACFSRSLAESPGFCSANSRFNS
jgi:putative ABC transport system permease protein